jgi:hypothetical protein
MRCEIVVDESASRQHRLGALAFVLSVLLFVPAVFLALSLASALLGREAVAPFVGPALSIGFATLPATWLLGTWQALRYRCPRCRRLLPRVELQDAHREENIRYGCETCGVIWDLGWHFGETA